MDNQDIQENQVIIVNESEKNPRRVSLEGHKSEEGNLQPKKGKNLHQVLFQGCIRKAKRNVERENLLQIAVL